MSTDPIYVQGRPVAGVCPNFAVHRCWPLAVCIKQGREYVVQTQLGGAVIAKAGNPHRAWQLAAAAIRDGTIEAS